MCSEFCVVNCVLFNLTNQPSPLMVDCASQTDFPWTEEDEKREKRRRKRERAEMRKQMYLMKSEGAMSMTEQPLLSSAETPKLVGARDRSSSRGRPSTQQLSLLGVFGTFFF